MDRKVVKLSKDELNLLLDFISKDNCKYGLILKLVYVYGRSIGEVLKLRVEDVDWKHNTIDFNLPTENVSFMIHRDIYDDLLSYLHHFEGEYLFLDNNEPSHSINMYSNTLNGYIKDFIKQVNRDYGLSWSIPSLICTDFRRLRGQHLFLDGADVNSINTLFRMKSRQPLKNTIKYSELKKIKYPCDSVDKIFHEYTDIKLFKEDTEDNLFSMISLEGNVYFDVDYDEGKFNVLEYDSKSALDLFYELSSIDLIDELFVFSRGNYKFFGNVKIIKV